MKLKCPYDQTDMSHVESEDVIIGAAFWADADYVEETHVCPTCHRKYTYCYEYSDGDEYSPYLADENADNMWTHVKYNEWVQVLPRPEGEDRTWKPAQPESGQP